MMKYEQQILEAFTKLDKSPRGNQLADINSILSLYLDEGYKNVILNAPTGSGKSIIGAVVAEVLHKLNPIQTDEGKGLGSFILMQNNILVSQYFETFKDFHKDFIMVKGANNYSCDLLSTSLEEKFADSCCKYDLLKSKNPDLIKLVNDSCETCEFQRIRELKNRIPHLITNYSYYFIDRLFIKKTPPRTITVWDECHTINDVFSEHCSIFINVKRLESISEELASEFNCTKTELFKEINQLKQQLIDKKVTESNYIEFIDKLYDIYVSAKKIADDFSSSLNIATDLKTYTKATKIAKKYFDLKCKIGDLFHYEYEHIFDFNAEKQEFSIKPIFVSTMFKQLENSKYQLFMSATVSEQLLLTTLGLDGSETKFIKLDSTFPKQNNKLVFHGIEKLNYEKMKNINVINKLGDVCSKIVKNHVQNGESGIILTPSFDITFAIASLLKESGAQVYEHKRGEGAEDVVNRFKKSKKASVLLSPSIWEGVSLNDDISVYQIIVKTPYPSLGDKRTKFICENHKDLYMLTTLLKIIQGLGRSVRSESDRCTTYILDQQMNWIWRTPANVWSSYFDVSFKQFL